MYQSVTGVAKRARNGWMDDDMAVSVVVDWLYRDLRFTAVGMTKSQCRQTVIFSNKYESSLDFLIRGFAWGCS